MGMDQDIEQEAARMADRVANDMARLITDRSSIGNATIHVSAGGVGLWIAVTCCVCMFCMLIFGSLWSVYQFEQINRQVEEIHASESKMQAYLNVIYQKVPQLKPEQDHGKQ